MALKINTSFKETEEEIKLYTETISHSDKSGYIKDALKFYAKYKHLGAIFEEMCVKVSKEGRCDFLENGIRFYLKYKHLEGALEQFCVKKA
ncbi:hypothetical protein [Clostridium sp. ZS2-4]|uniref:hypothetical protein n=1 Tax=Clostridium sp. ZS2-4 TaxID=2987703 RepID=UPI00227C666B|nr:hypothetical protein [Clostridium sp. ZS2-4]MCY6355358.1 hypothetical protein [Clostridium sp. ZS2-4]